MARQYISDPELLSKLEGGTPSRQYISDPALLRQLEGNAEPQSTGKSVGEYLGKTFGAENLLNNAAAIAEVPAALGTGAIGRLAGNVAGTVQKMRGKSDEDARATRDKYQDVISYKPNSPVSKDILRGFEWAATPITEAGRFGGDVYEGVTGDKFGGDVISDTVSAAVPVGVAKGAGAAKRGAGKTVEYVTRPETLLKGAAGAATVGEFGTAGALTGAAGASSLARRGYQAVKDRKATQLREKYGYGEADPVSAAVVDPLARVSTKEAAAARAADFKTFKDEQIARNRARRQAQQEMSDAINNRDSIY